MKGAKVIKDLSATFGPIRDQGARPTCLAFAASDTHAALRGAWSPLSTEYIFCRAQQHSGRPPTQGAILSSILLKLKDEGQPHEASWPYSSVCPSKLASWSPPANVSPLFRRDGVAVAASLDMVIEALDDDRPVIMLIYLSTDFFRTGVSGIVDISTSSPPDPQRRHAVIAMAHGEIGGRRAVLIRNSWGSRWGYAGCAWLTEDFLQHGFYGMAVLREDPDVSSSSIAA
jgi:hypothetical protein